MAFSPTASTLPLLKGEQDRLGPSIAIVFT